MKLIEKPFDVALFNAYFINIGRSLSDQIYSLRSSHKYLGKKANANFTFAAVNEECIDTIVKCMKSKSSTGYDEILNKLIKHARSVLVKPNSVVNESDYLCKRISRLVKTL